MTRDIFCNQMRQITFIRTLDSAANNRALHHLEQYHMVARLNVTMGGRAKYLAWNHSFNRVYYPVLDLRSFIHF